MQLIPPSAIYIATIIMIIIVDVVVVVMAVASFSQTLP
jgi:hypothetical protein